MRHSAKKLRELFGRGFYTVPEASRLLHVPSARVRRWAAGYEFKKGSEYRQCEPLIHRELTDDYGHLELTFLDLVEMFFIREFLQKGVSLPFIRRASKAAAEILETDHPFSDKKFATDGHTIFAWIREHERFEDRELSKQDAMLIDLRDGQHVFNLFVSPYLQLFDYDMETDFAKRWWPLGRHRKVVIDPQLGFGTPVVAGFGVPTRALAQAARSGQTLNGLADWYELPVEAIKDALSFENALAA